MTYENFKRIIPADVQEKIKQLAEEIEFRDILSGWQESMSEQTISPIEGNYRDGWMPNQDGGYSVDQFYLSDVDSTYHFTKKQTECLESDYQEMLNTFMSDYDIEEIDYDNPDLLDKLCNYENEWFDPALLQFQVFVEREDKFDDRSPMSVVCRLSINYKDAPYYREKYAEDIRVISYAMEEFMQTENHVIIEEFRI